MFREGLEAVEVMVSERWWAYMRGFSSSSVSDGDDVATGTEKRPACFTLFSL